VTASASGRRTTINATAASVQKAAFGPRRRSPIARNTAAASARLGNSPAGRMTGVRECIPVSRHNIAMKLATTKSSAIQWRRFMRFVSGTPGGAEATT
jgi:hypothetical protein